MFSAYKTIKTKKHKNLSCSFLANGTVMFGVSQLMDDQAASTHATVQMSVVL